MGLTRTLYKKPTNISATQAIMMSPSIKEYTNKDTMVRKITKYRSSPFSGLYSLKKRRISSLALAGGVIGRRS
jgi:hypothetical protein